jgi:hypothetical protein
MEIKKRAHHFPSSSSFAQLFSSTFSDDRIHWEMETFFFRDKCRSLVDIRPPHLRLRFFQFNVRAVWSSRNDLHMDICIQTRDKEAHIRKRKKYKKTHTG